MYEPACYTRDMTGFQPVLENAALKQLIREEIERFGQITFARYMDLVLYHPRYGYYHSRRDKIGRGGDYITSPEVHPIFGAIIARQLVEMWEQLGRPTDFDLVEIGGGTGALARDILTWVLHNAPEGSAALRYLMVEVSTDFRARQTETLEEAGVPPTLVRWLDHLPSGIRGCVLSNELIDAFPVHLVTVENGQLRELYVTWRGGRFVEIVGEPSTPALTAYFDRLGLLPGENCRAEVNLEALRWMERVATALAQGFVLTFDYGYPAEELYAPWRRQGTLLCFYRHGFHSDPYVHVGRQDITTHVDFTSLVEAGRAHGLKTLGLVRQSEFLTNLGIAAALAPPEGRDFEEYAARRRAVLELIDPAGLGRIRVLVQAKSLPDITLTGLQGSGAG